jgi:hypothetical protein
MVLKWTTIPILLFGLHQISLLESYDRPNSISIWKTNGGIEICPVRDEMGMQAGRKKDEMGTPAL